MKIGGYAEKKINKTPLNGLSLSKEKNYAIAQYVKIMYTYIVLKI